MKIHDCIQGSEEWFRARAGIPTASEMDNLVTPLFKPREGAGVETYLSKKLAERWLGGPLPEFSSSWEMESGKIREEEAIPFFELEFKTEVRRVGFITSDDGRVGCSPDGLLEVGGLEIKCPQAHTHAGYLIRGGVPKEYLAQIHGSMYVTGALEWKFMSYHRKFPPLVLTVKRDEKIIATIHAAVSEFCDNLDAAYKRLVDINGGEPERFIGREKAAKEFPDIDHLEVWR